MTLDRFMYHFGTNLKYFELCIGPEGVLALHDEWATPNPNTARRRAVFQAANFASKPVIISFSPVATARIESAGEDHYKVTGTFVSGFYTATVIGHEGADVPLDELVLEQQPLDCPPAQAAKQRRVIYPDSENYFRDCNAWKNKHRN